MSGPTGSDGHECSVHCPIQCGKDEMHCDGGRDYWGCPKEQTCLPSKGVCHKSWNKFRQAKYLSQRTAILVVDLELVFLMKRIFGGVESL